MMKKYRLLAGAILAALILAAVAYTILLPGLSVARQEPSGLEVEIAGSGTAREQAPAPGAMVTPGTKIVVRCAR